jgi:transposase InsO family protein
VERRKFTREFKLEAAKLVKDRDRSLQATTPNRKWIADFTYLWTVEGWLYVAAVIDLFSRRVVGWSMSAAMTAQLVTDAGDGDLAAGQVRCAAAPFRSWQPGIPASRSSV